MSGPLFLHLCAAAYPSAAFTGGASVPTGKSPWEKANVTEFPAAGNFKMSKRQKITDLGQNERILLPMCGFGVIIHLSCKPGRACFCFVYAICSAGMKT